MKKEKMLPEDSANTAKAVEKPNFSLIDENFLKSRIYTIRGVKVMPDADLATRQSMALIRLFKQMKDYIVAENKQLLGNDGIAQIALQAAQNTRDIAEHSADIAYTKIYGMAKKNIIIIDNFSLRSIF